MPKSSIYNHVSPGVYSREIIDLSVSEDVDNGLTSLGVVGETENGKAFETTRVKSWEDFNVKYGGTNPEIFEKSKYPRYELPYIANTYLEQSNNMTMTRVLGMSGYNAGPAWVITAKRVLEKSGDTETKYDHMVVAVLRSRAFYVDYEKYPTSALTENDYKCCHLGSYDKINFLVGEISHKPECTYVTHYNPNALSIGAYHYTNNFGDDCETYIGAVNEEDLSVDYTNHGRFSINGFTGIGEYGQSSKPNGSENFSYSVTLNPADSNYILKVFGTDPNNGKTPIYVETLYDNALNEGIANGTITNLNSELVFYDVCYSADLVSVPPVNGLVEKEDGALTKRDYGKRLLYSKNTMPSDVIYYDFIANGSKYVVVKKYGACSEKEEDEETGELTCVSRFSGKTMVDGGIYTVLSYEVNGKNKYVYGKIHPRKKGVPLTYDSELEEYASSCYDDEDYDKLISVSENVWLSDYINKVELGISPNIDSYGNVFNNTIAVKNKKDGKYYVLSPDHYELQKKTGMVLDNVLYAGTLREPKTIYGTARYPRAIRRFYGKDGKVKKTEVLSAYTVQSGYLVNVTIYDTNHNVKAAPSTSNSGSTYNGFLVTNDFLNRFPLEHPNGTVISATSNEDYPVYSANTVLSGRIGNIENYKCSGTTYNVNVCTLTSTTENTRFAASGNSVGVVDASKLATATKLIGWTVVLNTQAITTPQRNKNYARSQTSGTPHLDYYFNFGSERGGLSNLRVDHTTAYYTDMYFYGKANGTLPVTCDFNNYKEPYRCAKTPWFVSNVKGDSQNMNVTKLFRFNTVKDGKDTTNLIKVSIADISLDDGTFTVYIRDINDTDNNPQIYESYTKCNLSPNSPDYIAYRIGSTDGMYPRKSMYVTVEMAEGLDVSNSVPCGIIGYPTFHFEGVPMVYDSRINPYREYDIVDEDLEEINGLIKSPDVMYNTIYDTSISNRKQFFGLSDLVGIDKDMFLYKGLSAYDDKPESLTKGFHLDCRLNENSYTGDDFKNINITVNGDIGYFFETVDITNQSSVYPDIPIFDTDDMMINTIYSNKNLRKFTVYFYGGFDGWDEHRDYRSTMDRFKTENYKGYFNNFIGEGFSFSKLWNYSTYDLPSDAITSDWYAFLRGTRMYANPQSISINVFATPGIDCINSSKLCDTIIDMLEEERGDTVYVMTLPDKPFGASDSINEMYDPEIISDYLYETNIDSSYACVYYPWVKYDDVENSQYIYLPPTKDVVRNMAILDNSSYPWFAPAGKNNGYVECVEPRFKTKLEDEDVLYNGRINAVKQFSYEGSYIWGQKNLQYDDNQLNRIATRRLVSFIKKELSNKGQSLIFEPNDDKVVANLSEVITNVMGNIQHNRGITDFTYKIDTSVDLAASNELPTKIWFKPISALEYIPIDLILTSNGIEFN